MGNTILAILEQREGKLKKSAFETTSVAAKLAKDLDLNVQAVAIRSEERRVGKECRSRWSPYH